MKPNLIILTSALLFVMTSVYGQVSLFDMDVASSDSLEKSVIHSFSPGGGGREKVWNFSGKLKSRESSQVKFLKDSTGAISIIEPGRIGYYRISSDTLILFGSESPLERRVYHQEKVSKKFPLVFGDSIMSSFKCEGMYCGDHPFRETGTITAKVDAIGTLVLAEDKSIENVRRVHTIDSYSICMDTDSAALDTAQLTQVINERYEWYVSDSQYPIIESITSTTYYNMDVIGTTRLAYCNLPESMTDMYIIDEDEPDEMPISSEDKQQKPDIIHYNIETLGKVIHLSYSLDADVTIMTLVANHMGMLCKTRQWTQAAGQNYSVEIDCNGLRPGIYILYINVNGKVYSEKVTL